MSSLINTTRSRIYYCAAAGCEVNSRTHPLERLFRFPRSNRNLERYQKWVEFSKNPRLRKDKPVEAYMCARHFTRNQFRTEYQMTLVYQAVPSIPSENYMECQYNDPVERSCEVEIPSYISPLPFLQDENLFCPKAKVSCNNEDDNFSFISEYTSQIRGQDVRDSGGEHYQENNQISFPPHITDHNYSISENAPCADHTYHSNPSLELLCDSSSGSDSPTDVTEVLIPDLAQEELPWYKIKLTSHNEDTGKNETELMPSIENKTVEEAIKKVDIQSRIIPRQRPDSAKIQMSVSRYRAFLQREKQLSATLKKKEQALNRLTRRNREKVVKIKELSRSNTELTKLVEALSNSVSVCCDLLGIHDVVFKT